MSAEFDERMREIYRRFDRAMMRKVSADVERMYRPSMLPPYVHPREGVIPLAPKKKKGKGY